MSKRKIYNYLFILLYWIVVVNFLTTFSVIAVRGFMRVAGIHSDSITDDMARYWISPAQYIEAALSGFFLGLLFLLVNELSNKFHWDHLGFGRLILIKTTAYALGLIVIIVAIYFIINSLGFYPQNFLVEFEFSTEITIMFIMIAIFIVSQIVLLNYVIQVNRKIGDFNVISFLTGKYRTPILENRLFMFLDLRSSTTIAEKLGEVQYSQFLRDCFRDFNYVITPYESLNIYQYVGDEVVVTSKWNNERDVEKTIDLYFSFSRRLKKRLAHYESNYGVIPYFKAGIHGGRVSVAEIGTLRRDIAFHGDVINTASRIQNLCNELNHSLLISAGLVKQKNLNYSIEELGLYHLRGKEDEIEIAAVGAFD